MKNDVKLRYPLIAVVFWVIASAGCATAPPSAREYSQYWPQQPEAPRIALKNIYYGEADFRKGSFLDAIFGRPPMRPMAQPYGVAAAGNLIYVADSGNGEVLVIDTKERKIGHLGSDGEGKLQCPLGIALASDGTVFVSDGKLSKIMVFNASGELKRAIGKKGEFKNPGGLAIDEVRARLYVVDVQAHVVRVYTLNGEFLFELGKRGFANGEFNYPSNIAVDRRNGNVYVVDTNNFRVQVFDPDGTFLRKFGELGDQPGNFSRPKGVGIDSEGHVYIADAAFDNFQIFDEQGVLLLYVGSAGFRPGFFQLPAGLFVDAQDRIYVVDSLNNRVQVFQYLSEGWKKDHPEEYNRYLPH